MSLRTKPSSTPFRRFHPFIATFSAAACLLSLAGCATSADTGSASGGECKPAAEVKTIKDGKLSVLVAEYPPFVSMEGRKLTGIEGEVLQRLADSLCLELNASSTSFAAVIEGLQTGRADISAGSWSVNEEREKLFEVSKPMFTGGMGIVTRGEDWKTVEDLQGKKIGTPQGYVWMDQVIAAFGQANISEYQSDQAVLDDVAAGRIDAGLVAVTSNGWRLQQDQYSELSMVDIEATPKLPYTQNPPLIVALIQKGNAELRDAANAVIDEYISSGDMAEQFKKYGVSPDLILSSK